MLTCDQYPHFSEGTLMTTVTAIIMYGLIFALEFAFFMLFIIMDNVEQKHRRTRIIMILCAFTVGPLLTVYLSPLRGTSFDSGLGPLKGASAVNALLLLAYIFMVAIATFHHKRGSAPTSR